MKNYSLTLLMVFTVALLYAQSSKVNSAFASYSHAQTELAAGDIEKAVASLKDAAENIEPATEDAKTSLKSKTWRYRGNIYAMIAGIESMDSDYPDATDKAIVSFKKAMELDQKGSYTEEITQSVKAMYNAELNKGIEAYNNKDYPAAVKSFETNSKLYEVINLTDTMGIYNGALSADLGGMKEKAVEMYIQSAELDYEAEYCYVKATNILQELEQYDRALEVSKLGRLKFPNSQNLIIAQLNVYLKSGMYEEAETDLEAAAAEKPNDPSMWFALGVVKENLDKKDEGAEAYKKSLEVDPDYYNSNMNLAILYFSKASELINAANEIPVNEIEKYDAAKAEAMVELKKAVPYFEKAYELNPDNKNVLLDLKEAYGQLNDTENYNRVKEMIDNSN